MCAEEEGEREREREREKMTSALGSLKNYVFVNDLLFDQLACWPF